MVLASPTASARRVRSRIIVPIDEHRHVLAQRRLVIEHVTARLRILCEDIRQNLAHRASGGVRFRTGHMALDVGREHDLGHFLALLRPFPLRRGEACLALFPHAPCRRRATHASPLRRFHVTATCRAGFKPARYTCEAVTATACVSSMAWRQCDLDHLCAVRHVLCLLSCLVGKGRQNAAAVERLRGATASPARAKRRTSSHARGRRRNRDSFTGA